MGVCSSAVGYQESIMDCANFHIYKFFFVSSFQPFSQNCRSNPMVFCSCRCLSLGYFVDFVAASPPSVQLPSGVPLSLSKVVFHCGAASDHLRVAREHVLEDLCVKGPARPDRCFLSKQDMMNDNGAPSCCRPIVMRPAVPSFTATAGATSNITVIAAVPI